MNATVRPDSIRARDQLLAAVEAQRATLALYLPQGVALEQFLRLARDAILAQPQLAECSSDSVLRALARCASSGLPLDGKFSSLIVRKNKHGRPTATWDPSYRGMITLALASGIVRDVQAYVVRSDDEFRAELGSEPRVVHVPCLLPRCGEVIASYAVATLANGGRVLEVLGRGDLEKIRAMSPAGESGPWSTWCDEQARKSAIRRLLKRLPAAPANMLAPMAELHRVEVATANATPAVARSNGWTSDLEYDNALECAALERLNAADSLSELEAAFAQSVVDFQQAGAALPLRVEALRNDRRELFQQQDDG